MTEFQRPVVLDPRAHDRSSFTSGEPVLDEWLRRYAGQSQRRNTARTWVICPAGEPTIAAYASLATTSIARSRAPAALAGGAPDPVPALLIGRLAVDSRYAGLGLGTTLVRMSLAAAIELNQVAACRAIVANALHLRARGWWERFGFRPFDSSDPESLDLYLLTIEVEGTLRRLT